MHLSFMEHDSESDLLNSAFSTMKMELEDNQWLENSQDVIGKIVLGDVWLKYKGLGQSNSQGSHI